MGARRTLRAWAAAAVCLGVMACGGGDGDSAPASSAAGATTQPTVTTTEPTASDPGTAAPATTEPSATDQSTTESSATDQSASEPSATEPPNTAPTQPIFVFASAADVEGWSVVNDTVMGGVSSGRVAWVDGALAFTGELSLENNGGFASVRSPQIDPEDAAAWATRVGPRLVVQGDGRTWTVEVRTGESDGGWIANLPTSPDEPTEVEPAWTSFEPVTRFLEPRGTDTPLDPARIVSIAFYLVDGVEGPFSFDILSIA